MSTDNIWTTLAFTAAPAGWRLVIERRPSRGRAVREEWPLPGWLSQENQHGERRVVPAHGLLHGCLVSVTDHYKDGDTYGVAGPGQSTFDKPMEAQR